MTAAAIITGNDVLTSRPRMIILQPIAQITCRMKKSYDGLKVIASVTIAISTTSSHNPLLIRNALNSLLDLVCPLIYAEIPDRKRNTGAQKCVIHLVKKSAGVVVARLVGSSIIAGV